MIGKGEPIVSHPFSFIIEKENGALVRLMPGKLTFSNPTPARIGWTVADTSAEFDLQCTGEMEFDGYVNYGLKLISKVEEYQTFRFVGFVN